jgi:DNA-binding PadR family transcriptional regulator
MRTSRAIRSRTAALTTTEHAVLTVLTVETRHRAVSGYDLLKLVEKSVGYIWTPTKSHLYAVLPRLVERGLATQRSAPAVRGPERQLYRVTKKGERLTRMWLEEPVPGDSQLFMLKTFYGGLQSPDSLVAHYRQYVVDRQEYLDVLRAVELTNTRTGHDYFHYFLLQLGIQKTELEIAWAENAIAELER